MKTAIFLRRLEDWRGDAHLYLLSEPVLYELSDGSTGHTYYVVVSGVIGFSGPETFIFPAYENGETIDMLEIDGSFRGEINHIKALTKAGYEIVVSP